MPAVSEYFKTVDQWDDGVHRYRVLTPHHEDWLSGLAALYRELRTASQVPLDELGLTGLDGFDIKDLTTVLVETQLPRRYEKPEGKRDMKHLAVERSDIGELALALVGELHHGYSYGYRSVRDRELVSLPGRGVDQIGVAEVELEPGVRSLVLSMGEAKVSVDKKSPPAVVDTSSDCLRLQHIGHITEIAASVQKVLSAARATADKAISLQLYKAAMLWRNESDQLVVRSTSMLVRDRGGSEADFGTFRTSPTDYDPGHIDFTVLVLDVDDIEVLVDEFLALARQEAA